MKLYSEIHRSSFGRAILGFAFLLFTLNFGNAQGLPLATPASVGMNAAKLDQIEALVNADIADKKLPGAVVIVGRKGKIVYRKAFGNRSLVPTVEKMTVDTIFDVASLTKPVATATSIMILIEQGKLRLNDTIGKFIPDIDDPEAKKVTIQQLLTHTSGYRPDFDLSAKWTGREGMLAALKKEKLRAAPGTRFVYSDIGFIVLGEIVERIEKRRNVGFFAQSEVFVRSGMRASGYSELSRGRPDFTAFDGDLNPYAIAGGVAPTENVRGQNSYLGATFDGVPSVGEEILRGKVHDPTAFRMFGIAGHAGLFSTADDLAKYGQMLLNGGTLNGRRILSAQTVAKMTQPYVVAEDGSARGLGWDMDTSFSANRGDLFPKGSFGHTGFTGTSIWIDPTSQTFYVFLSNRVHPDGKGDVTPLRGKVATVVASAIEDLPIEKWKQAEAKFNTTVAAQIPGFVERKKLADPFSNLEILVAPQRPPQVRFGTKNGIDVLESRRFADLEGKKIGLVTNHTGRNLAGKSTIDILHEAKNVDLVSIFAPEHGIRGELDTEKIDDTQDENTGQPVFSLL